MLFKGERSAVSGGGAAGVFCHIIMLMALSGALMVGLSRAVAHAAKLETNFEIVTAALSPAEPHATDGDAGVNPDKDKNAASAAISGSPWPGVIDHLLQKPISSASREASIHINYPSIGDKRVDADIRNWVGSIAEAFETHLDMAQSLRESSDELENLAAFPHDDDLNSEQAYQDNIAAGTFELWGAYDVTRPSDAAVSVTFELWNYTGAPQGNLDILTLNYSLLTGQRLSLVDIFEKPDIALELMSSWSRQELAPRLGAAMRTKMLETGTEPLAENFSSLTLTPEGIRINFQPWQVAPWNAGIQKVDMPLEELRGAEPLLALWGK